MDSGMPDGANSFWSTGSFSQQKEEMRAQLKSRLSSLPAPKNDYEIVIPEVKFYLHRYILGSELTLDS